MLRRQGDVVLMQKKAMTEQACLKLMVFFFFYICFCTIQLAHFSCTQPCNNRENSSRDCPQQKAAAANLNGQEASLTEGQQIDTLASSPRVLVPPT